MGKKMVTRKYDESPKRKRARKAPKDPNAPKKGRNAFLHFANETHRDIQKDANFKLRVAETTMHASDLWKKMSVEEKAKYVEMARIDKMRYVNELNAYLKKKKEEAIAPVAEKKEKDEDGKTN